MCFYLMPINLMHPIYHSFELPTDTTWMEIPEFSPHAYEVEVAEYKGTTNKVVMIIVWKWGTTSGYQNKYITIASNLAEKYGVSVFVVENPWISRDDPKLFVECAMGFVEEQMKKSGFDDWEIYGMGHSAGAHFWGRFAHLYPNVSKLLLINPVVSVNFTKLKKELQTYQGELFLIQWSKDHDFFYNPLLDPIKTDKKQVIILEWVNHEFSNEGGFELFLSLAETYLF